MKYIKLSLFSLFVIFFGCFTSRDLPSSKYYKIQSDGYYVISDECPEFKRLIKEGHMRIYKYCGDVCWIHFDNELYNYYMLDRATFYSNLCVKTQEELNILYGHEVKTIYSGENEAVYLSIWTGKSLGDNLAVSLGYYLDKKGSIINNNEF